MNYAVNALNVPGMAAAPATNGQAVARAVPFVRAANKCRVTGESKAVTIGTAVQNMSLVIPAIGGWNRRVVLQVEAVVPSANSAAVAYQADAPFNALSQILFKDSAQKQLVLFTNGYYAYLMNNFGGYKTFKMDASTRGYAAVTGAGATGGNFTFFLTLPQECSRDGICSYPNMDASQRLTVDLTINTAAAVYSTAPTALPVITVTPVVYYYSKPAATTAQGMAQETVPPGAGSVQFWRTSQFVLANGNNIVTVNLSGRFLRNIIAVFTDASDVRSDTVRPTTVRAELDNNLIFDSGTKDWDSDIYRSTGLDTATGMLPILLGTLDPDGIQGNEWADDWWATSTSSQLVLKLSAGAAGKMYLLLNEVEAQGEIFR